MKQPEKIVKTFYDALNEDKILAKRCKRCGAYEYPPVASCNECSGHDMEWAQISGEAEVIEILQAKGMLASPAFEDLAPYALGVVRLKEGPETRTIIRGITDDNVEHIRANMPYPAKAELVAREGYRRVVFRIVEE